MTIFCNSCIHTYFILVRTGNSALNSLTCIDFPFQHVHALRTAGPRPPVLEQRLRTGTAVSAGHPALPVRSCVWSACSGGLVEGRGRGRVGFACRCWPEHCASSLCSERLLPRRDRRLLLANPGVDVRPRLGLAQPPRGSTRTLCSWGVEDAVSRRGCAELLCGPEGGSASPGFAHAAPVQSRTMPGQGPLRVLVPGRLPGGCRAWETPAGAGGLRAEAEPGGGVRALPPGTPGAGRWSCSESGHLAESARGRQEGRRQVCSRRLRLPSSVSCL